MVDGRNQRNQITKLKDDESFWVAKAQEKWNWKSFSLSNCNFFFDNFISYRQRRISSAALRNLKNDNWRRTRSFPFSKEIQFHAILCENKTFERIKDQGVDPTHENPFFEIIRLLSIKKMNQKNTIDNHHQAAIALSFHYVA